MATLALSALAPTGIAVAGTTSNGDDIISPSFVAKAEKALAQHKQLTQKQRAAIAVHFAYQHIGDWYMWGGNGPHRWDCSGLVVGAWRAAGIHLPRISYEMYNTRYKHVAWRDLQPGDVIEFHAGRTHVGIYVGNGYMIHAPQTGEQVRKEKLTAHRRGQFNGAIRPGAY